MKKLLTLDIILVFILFVWGSVVRTKGAGLACPDWPLCHGKIIPPMDTLVLLEWGHRLIAAGVGFLTLGIGIKIFFSESYRKVVGWLMGVVLPLLILQVILGALTVKQLLHSYFVTVHVAAGTLFFALLIVMLLKLKDARYVIPVHVGIKRMMWFLTLFIYVQIILGTLVSSSHAGLACPDFPTCLGQWIPPLIGTVAYHFFHRMLAYLILMVIIGLWLLKAPVKVHLILILIQMGLGISNVLFKLPLPLSVAHLAIATALFSMVLVTAYKVTYARVS